MAAKETVMSDAEIWKVVLYAPSSNEPVTIQDGRRVAQAQAEKTWPVAFKAGQAQARSAQAVNDMLQD